MTVARLIGARLVHARSPTAFEPPISWPDSGLRPSRSSRRAANGRQRQPGRRDVIERREDRAAVGHPVPIDHQRRGGSAWHPRHPARTGARRAVRPAPGPCECGGRRANHAVRSASSMASRCPAGSAGRTRHVVFVQTCLGNLGILRYIPRLAAARRLRGRAWWNWQTRRI